MNKSLLFIIRLIKILFHPIGLFLMLYVVLFTMTIILLSAGISLDSVITTFKIVSIPAILMNEFLFTPLIYIMVDYDIKKLREMELFLQQENRESQEETIKDEEGQA